MFHWPLKQYFRRNAEQVKASMLDPEGAQKKAFSQIQKSLRGSHVAYDSNFSKCRNLEDCRKLDTSNAELLPLLEAAFVQGVRASRLFGNTPILGFARTSGTTAVPKDIPINHAYLKSLDRSLARMVSCQLHTMNDWENLLRGKRVLLGSRPLLGHSPTGLPLSDISGLIPTRTWRSLRFLYVPRHKDLWIDDWQKKVDLILSQSSTQKVISISGIPALAFDFARKAREKFGVKYLSEIWPELNHYIYGSTHLDAEQKQAISDDWLGPGKKLHFVETYFSTEAALGFTENPNDEGMALNTLENIYVFRSYAENSPPLFAHELEEGQTYSIHVTTAGGLIQYRMGDGIEVISKRPLRIKVVGREVEEISLTGEKINLLQLELSLKAAGVSIECGYLPVFWVEQGEKPSLVWGLPEPRSRIQPRAEYLALKLDQALCEFNVLFSEAFVHEKVVAPSKVCWISRSIFDRYQAKHLGLGQFKARRLFKSEAEFKEIYDLNSK